MSHTLPIRFPRPLHGEAIEVSCIDGTSCVFSTHAKGSFSVLFADTRRPETVLRMGVDFWRGLGGHGRAGLARPVALAVRGSRIAVTTLGGSVLAGCIRWKEPVSASCGNVPRGCVGFVDDGILAVGTAGADPELLIMHIKESPVRMESVAREQLMSPCTGVVTCSTSVACVGADANATIYGVDAGGMRITHMIPGLSAVVSMHDNLLLARDQSNEQEVVVLDTSAASVATPLARFVACNAHVREGVVHAIEAWDGEPALVRYSVSSEPERGVARQIPRRLGDVSKEGAVNFEMAHSDGQAMVMARMSQQLWVM